MKVPFTWKPTGWFMIGWSADFPAGEVRPITYFGEDLVAYRTDDGALNLLTAHCPHLGAHIGHGGKVNGDCVECPYHGWGYGPDGTNRYIPYEDRPNVSKSLGVRHIVEQHECVLMWHDPAGGPPRWEHPDVFTAWDDLAATPEDYYRAYPEASIRYELEPVHPQIPLENAPDSMHFTYVHHATVNPRLLWWEDAEHEWRFVTGFPKPTDDDPDHIALRVHGIACGVGGTINVFEGGSYHYRVTFRTTPVDDERSNMFYSIWWPRDEGDTSDVIPEKYLKRLNDEFLATLWDDLEIWRYQIYVEHPALAQQDAKPYGSLRRWARRFYEVEPGA